MFDIGCKIFTIAGLVILYGILTSWGLGLRFVRELEQFADSFYQKPIDTLLNLTSDAEQVLKQLETILAYCQENQF